jgi:uncharacterized protein
MKVALIGASGRVWSRLATELLRRGHQVTGIVRKPGEIAARPGMTVKQGDATNASALAAVIAGHDAVISASRFQTSDPKALLAALRSANVSRLLVVGGAGSLAVAPGKALMNAADFPEAFKAEATAGAQFLEALRQEHDLDWTFLSPSANFAPGERTGTFRLGGDELLVDANGKSWISMEDFAVAMVDELEHPRHRARRFTVGY